MISINIEDFLCLMIKLNVFNIVKGVTLNKNWLICVWDRIYKFYWKNKNIKLKKHKKVQK